LGAFLWHTHAALPAAESPRAPALPAESLFADCRLTVLARQSLQKDELLAALNLGVSVQSRTATLWGAIPSAELARRAEELVRQVPGGAEGQNDLRIEGSDLPTKELFVRSFSP